MIAGVVYDPIRQETVHASAAARWLNQPAEFRVSNIQRLGQPAMHRFPQPPPQPEREYPLLLPVGHGHARRGRTGSAAIDWHT